MKLSLRIAVVMSVVAVSCGNIVTPDSGDAGDAGDAGYAVSGTITLGTGQDAGVVKLNEVQLTLKDVSNSTTISTKSNADGGYSFPSVKNGDYEVSPYKAGYDFAPPFRSFKVNSAAVPGLDFAISVLTAKTYVVSGKITTKSSDTSITARVSLELSGGTAGSRYYATSDATGAFSFPAVPAGNYTLTPPKTGITFTPTSHRVMVTTGPVTTGIDFEAVEVTYEISGTITAQTGQTVSLGGVNLSLSGASLTNPVNVQSGSDGKYKFPAVKNGDYTITPARIGSKFNPPTQPVRVNSGPKSGVDFTVSLDAAQPYPVSGTITGRDVADVELSLTSKTGGAGVAPVKSQADGGYVFPAVVNGEYTLTPFKLDFKFTPSNRLVNVGDAGVSAQDFAVSPDVYTVTGTITTKTSQNVDGVSLSLTGGTLTSPLKATSADGGVYTFSTKVKPGSYKVVPTKPGLAFTPREQPVAIADTNLNPLVTVAPIDAASDGLTCDTSGVWCRPLAPALASVLSNPIYRIWSASGTDLWFVGGSGTILRYMTPAGQTATWKQEDAGATNDLYAIWGRSSNEVWVAGTNEYGASTAIYSFDAGATPPWTKSLDSNASYYKYDINVFWGNSDSPDVWYGMCSGWTGRLPRAGEFWQRITSYIGETHVYGAWSATSLDQWIVGRTMELGGVSGPKGNSSAAVNGLMWRQQDGGSWIVADDSNFWTPELKNATASKGAWFGDIRGTTANDIWAVGTKGLIAHFNGSKWAVVDAGVGSTNLYGVWPVNANEVWFAGGDTTGTVTTGNLYKVTDAGGTWTSQSIATVPGDAGVFYRVYVDSTNKYVWLGSSTGILLYKY